MNKHASIAAALALCAIGRPLRAQEAPPSAVFASTDTLAQRVDRLESQVESLQRDLGAAPRKPTGGDLKLQFKGLIQTDGRFYLGSGANPAASGFWLRRARPELKGTMFGFYDFKFQPDFGENTAVIDDAYFDVRPWSFANLRIGKFKPPLGLERLRAARDLTFMERGLTADLMPSRDTGVEFRGGVFGGAIKYQTSLTNGTADAAHAPDGPATNAKELAARVFVQPFKNFGRRALENLGVGVAGSYAGSNPGIPVFRTATGQDQFMSYRSNVAFDGEQSHLIPQASYYLGPLGAYAEYAQTSQTALAGGARARLTNRAWQAAAFWVVAGGTASYKGVSPNRPFDPEAGTWGAWELAARFHQLWIDPRTFPVFADPTVSASRATAYTLALNWYLNDFVRLAADYEQTWFEGGGGAGNRPIERVLGTRAQLAF
ncbi:MAG TPA: porin [Elusimicrobiota bacterium]|nr:porin [Elusimicrobiota bacterium]